MNINKKYCLDGINYDELLNYVDDIKEEAKSFSFNDDGEIEKLKSKIMDLEKDLISSKNVTSKLESKMKVMDITIKDQAATINSLKNELKICKSVPFLYVEPSLTEPGLLELLKKQEKNQFNDPLFIVSQSSNDIYNLTDSRSSDDFSTNSNGHFFIEFEFEKEIIIKGITIFSATMNFPRSFNIEIDGRIIKSIDNASELNGKFKSMTIEIDSIKSKKIRFVQTGPNWIDKNYLHFKRFEILSEDKSEVFGSLIKKSENKDPHKCPVKITALCFDFNNFYSINSKKIIWTYSGDNSWFQVELTRGLAILKGFRINKSKSTTLRSYKIVCVDDANKPDESWINLFEIDEKTNDESKNFNIYQFDHPSPPVRFIRIIMTGPNWQNNSSLAFLHLDFFGYYF